LVDLAADALKQVIFDRQVEPGARLGIDATAKLLDMSITPVREAMARLTTQGLLVQDANRGFTVARLLTTSEFSALFATRRVLETAALETHARNLGVEARLTDPNSVSVAQIAALQAVAEQMRNVTHGTRYHEYAAFSRLDSEFHRLVVEFSGNRFLVNAWSGMNFHLHVSRLYTGSGVIDYGDALREHEAIVAAVVKRDPERLIETATGHALLAEARLVQLLPSNLE